MSAVPGPQDQPDPKRILVVLPTWVGDFVMATPTLRAIRSRFPASHIALLANPNLDELIRGGPWKDEMIAWRNKRQAGNSQSGAWGLVRLLKRLDFDMALLLSNSFRSALVTRLAGIPRRVGYDRDRRGFLLTDRLKPLQKARRFVPYPMVDYYGALAEAVGCAPPGDRLELFTRSDDEERVSRRLLDLGLNDGSVLVVVSPGASYGASKCWLPERFAELGDRLIERHGAAVVITCGPGEEGIARDIGAGMHHGGTVLDSPRLGLGELKALVRRASLLVCNDTGPRHFAKAFDVPVVTIFGPTFPEWTDTSYAMERKVLISVDCGPCMQRVCPLGHHKCMTGISVEMVLAACSELLALNSKRTPVPA